MSRARPTCHDIIEAVAHEWGYTRAIILMQFRRPELVEARKAAAYLMRVTFTYPLGRTAQALERDGSTTRHAIATAKASMVDSKEFADRLRKLEAMLRSQMVTARPGPARHRPQPQRAPAALRYRAPKLPRFRPPSPDTSEILRLRRAGWSLKALCRRFDLPMWKVAPIIGVRLGSEL